MSSATVSPVATVIATATSHLTGPAVATVCRRAASMMAGARLVVAAVPSRDPDHLMPCRYPMIHPLRS